MVRFVNAVPTIVAALIFVIAVVMIYFATKATDITVEDYLYLDNLLAEVSGNQDKFLELATKKYGKRFPEQYLKEINSYE